MTRRYRAELRDEQAAATRERLLQSAHRLLGHIRPVDLSYAQIADEAGVSVRTLYRHFPTSDDLFLGLSDRLLGQLGPGPPLGPPDLETAMAGLQRTFEMLESDPALFRVFFAVPTRSRTGGRAPFERLLAPYLEGLSADGRRAVCALVDLHVCPYAWDVLHANWGANAVQAFRASGAGIRAVLELAARDPGAFDRPTHFSEVPS